MTPYVAPALRLEAFNCPHCGAFADQLWGEMHLFDSRMYHGTDMQVARCRFCKGHSVWVRDTMVYPAASPAPSPSVDLPADVVADFEEARRVYSASPKASAALLRLVVQKLCVHLGQPGKNLNEDIGALVKLGLPLKVKQA